MKKILVFLIGLVFITTLSSNAIAESVTDPTGDVFHWWQSAGTFTWEYDNSKPDIDITEYGYDISGGTLTLTMTVAGDINNGELYSYTISFVSDTDSSTYMVTYVGGQGGTYYLSQTGGGTGEVSASGDTLTGSFETSISDPSNYEFIVTANQYTVLNDVTNEYWVDSNQLNEEDDSGSDGNSDENDDEQDTGSDDTGTDDGNNDENVPPPSGTPGFEIFALLTALIAIVFIIKRRN